MPSRLLLSAISLSLLTPLAAIAAPGVQQPGAGNPAAGRAPSSAPRQVGVVRRGSSTASSRRSAPPVLPAADGSLAGLTSLPTLPTLPPPTSQAPVYSVTARLGRVLAPTADAFRTPDVRSQWVSRFKKGQDLALIGQWQGWYAVLMGDGSRAFVPSTHVELLPYQVKSVSPAAPPPPPSFAVGQGQTATLASIQGQGLLAPPNTTLAQAVIQEAYRYQGTPYVWGGNTERGIDCSGLVRNCFSTAGVPLPRRASEQAEVGQAVPLDQLQPGDRLYFSVKDRFDHTGIYLGDGYFIHAARSRGKVGVDHLSTQLYGSNLEAARR